MYEGCKEKSGNFLLRGQACSCILLSNAHASKKGCHSANLPLKNLIAWHVQCGGNADFLRMFVAVDVLVSVEL